METGTTLPAGRIYQRIFILMCGLTSLNQTLGERLIGQLTEATRLLIEMAAEFRNENSFELREKRKLIKLDP